MSNLFSWSHVVLIGYRFAVTPVSIICICIGIILPLFIRLVVVLSVILIVIVFVGLLVLLKRVGLSSVVKACRAIKAVSVGLSRLSV